jgi:Rieske Fe-S protein
MKPQDGSSTRPLWAEEFSVHSAEDAYVLRRQFMKFLMLTSTGMFAGNIWIWAKALLEAPAGDLPHVPVARASEVPIGGVKLFTYPTPQDPCIMVRKTNGQLAAYSQKCTHLSCAVYYSAEHNRLECPCHEGYFSVETGRVLQGPPPRPLSRVHVVERDGEIVATGIDLQAENSNT